MAFQDFCNQIVEKLPITIIGASQRDMNFAKKPCAGWLVIQRYTFTCIVNNFVTIISAKRRPE